MNNIYVFVFSIYWQTGIYKSYNYSTTAVYKSLAYEVFCVLLDKDMKMHTLLLYYNEGER